MAAEFVGRFKLESQENYEQVLAAYGKSGHFEGFVRRLISAHFI